VLKGKDRPIFLQDHRAEVVDALGCVDLTVINPCRTAVEAIRILKPQFYVKGKEYERAMTPLLSQEKEALDAVGGVLQFTETYELHTSDVLGRIKTCK